MRIYFYFLFLALYFSIDVNAQLKWINVDSLYQPLPRSVHVFKSTDTLDGKPNIAYYVIADLKDKKLLFDADTTFKRRFTPTQFYQKNSHPLVVVNTTFFFISSCRIGKIHFRRFCISYHDDIRRRNYSSFPGSISRYSNRNSWIVYCCRCMFCLPGMACMANTKSASKTRARF